MRIALSVSKSIIDSHDGRLWAAKNDGPGSTFSFSIPLRTDAELSSEESSAETGAFSAGDAA